MREPERPVVTVDGRTTAPAWGDGAPPEDLQVPPADLRRWRWGALGAVLLLVAVGAVQAVSDARERSRLDGVLAVSARVVEGPTAAATPAGDVRVELDVAIGNDGPRPVDVVEVRLGDGPTGEGRRLEPGEQDALRLRQELPCPPAGDLVAEGEPLTVRATTAAGERTTTTGLGPGVGTELSEAVRRACGVLPLPEALDLQRFARDRVDGASVVVRLRLAARSAEDLVVQSVAAGGTAFAAALEGPPLPLRLAGRPPGSPTVFDPQGFPLGERMVVRLSVRPGQCDAARAQLRPGGQFGDPVLVEVVYADAEGTAADAEVTDDAGLLFALVGRVCR